MRELKLSIKELTLTLDCVVATYIQLTELDLDSTTGTQKEERKEFRSYILENIVQNIHFGLNYNAILILSKKQLDIFQMYLRHGEYWFDDELIRGSMAEIKKLEDKISTLLG